MNVPDNHVCIGRQSELVCAFSALPICCYSLFFLQQRPANQPPSYGNQ